MFTTILDPEDLEKKTCLSEWLSFAFSAELFHVAVVTSLQTRLMIKCTFMDLLISQGTQG